MSHRTVLGLKLALASICFLAMTIVAAIGMRSVTGYPEMKPGSETNSGFTTSIQTSEDDAQDSVDLNDDDREPASFVDVETLGQKRSSKSRSITLPKWSVFEAYSQLSRSELSLLSQPAPMRGQKVMVHFENLIDTENPRPRSVVLNLFPDVVWTVDLQAPSVYGVNSGLLVGLVQGDPESFVRIMIQDGVMDGTIRSRNREFRVISGGNGLHIVTEAQAH